MPFLIAIAVIAFLIYIFIFKDKHNAKIKEIEEKENKSENEDENIKEYTYHQKPLMTEMEKKFFVAIKQSVGEKYTIQPQVNLATIIENKVIFDIKMSYIVMLILEFLMKVIISYYLSK